MSASAKKSRTRGEPDTNFLCRYGAVVPVRRSAFDDDVAAFADYRVRARAFCEGLVEAHAQAERDGRFRRSVFRDAAREGFYCMNVPKEYGGKGLMDPRYSAIVTEETHRAGVEGFLGLLGSDMVLPYLLNYASDDQKRKWLPRVASGDCVLAVAMSEPHTGSDVANVQTRATLKADGYHISGRKSWISNGSIADLIIVVARTDDASGASAGAGSGSAGKAKRPHDGLSLFLVETNRRGFRCTRVLKKLALAARDVCELDFDDVVVPPSAVLGSKGRGFVYLMKNLARERMAVATAAIAASEVALDQTMEYVKKREVFGERLGDLQYPAIKLAEAKTEVTVGRVFLDKCLVDLSKGVLSSEVRSSCFRRIMSLSGRLEQFHGGFGFLLESSVDLGPSPIGKQWIAARIQPIYAGSNEVMKELIAKASGLKPRHRPRSRL